MPKQYAMLGGEPVLRRTLRAFVEHPRIDRVTVVIHPDDRGLYENAAADFKILPPVSGGATRRVSVLNGLSALEDDPPGRVLIHDAARPLVSPDIILRSLDALDRCAGAVAAVPVHDTLKQSDEAGSIRRTVPRTGLWRAQTPQAFHYDEILKAHRATNDDTLTDDAAVAERAGLTVALVEGAEENLKVTTEQDLARAEMLLRTAPSGTIRIGSGYDVHRFSANGDHVTLCGIAIPHEKGLAGHSDADVGLHALVDALLGAIAAGDIGTHFPPSDQRWAGADSRIFVEHARDLVAEAGGMIENVDVTLICERPRVGPHRQAMCTMISELLAIPANRVSVKATTTEGLGFSGRREGIAAQAIASVRIPA